MRSIAGGKGVPAAEHSQAPGSRPSCCNPCCPRPPPHPAAGQRHQGRSLCCHKAGGGACAQGAGRADPGPAGGGRLCFFPLIFPFFFSHTRSLCVRHGPHPNLVRAPGPRGRAAVCPSRVLAPPMKRPMRSVPACHPAADLPLDAWLRQGLKGHVAWGCALFFIQDGCKHAQYPPLMFPCPSPRRWTSTCCSNRWEQSQAEEVAEVAAEPQFTMGHGLPQLPVMLECPATFALLYLPSPETMCHAQLNSSRVPSPLCIPLARVC